VNPTFPPNSNKIHRAKPVNLVNPESLASPEAQVNPVNPVSPANLANPEVLGAPGAQAVTEVLGAQAVTAFDHRVVSDFRRPERAPVKERSS
jgi:hypothetical protein